MSAFRYGFDPSVKNSGFMPGGFNPTPFQFGAYHPEVGFGGLPEATRPFQPFSMGNAMAGAGFESGPMPTPPGAGKGGIPILGDIGKGIGKGVGYLTDKDQGLNRQILLSTIMAGVADLVGSYKRGKREDKERKDERRRGEALAPYLVDLMKGL